MNVEIHFEGTPTPRSSYDLRKLISKLRGAELTAKPITQPPESGAKDSGLIIGISLALTTVSTVAAVVATWGSKKTYSITHTCDDVSITEKNLTANELSAAISRIEADKPFHESRLHISVRKASKWDTE